MTIIVERRRHKGETRFSKAIRAARAVSREKLDSMDRLLIRREKVDKKLKGAAIRRYAKKHEIELQFHYTQWTFHAESGERVVLDAGYYALDKKGVLHRVIAR